MQTIYPKFPVLTSLQESQMRCKDTWEMLECPWTISFGISDKEWMVHFVSSCIIALNWLRAGIGPLLCKNWDAYKGKGPLETDMNRSDVWLDPFRATVIRNYHSSESYLQMKILNPWTTNQITVPKFLCSDWYEIIMGGPVQSNLWNHPSWGRTERELGMNCEKIGAFTP